jgi:hypothetical protein
MTLTLPGVTEADHHGRRSFRVDAGTVVATLWTEDQLNVLVGADLAHAASAQPGVELLHWGQRLSGVRVRLSVVEPALLEELLQGAWARRVPPASATGPSCTSSCSAPSP